MSVDSVAVGTDFPHVGYLLVEIPNDPEVYEHGGTIELVVEGRGESKSLGTFTYHDRQSKSQDKTPSAPAAGR